MTFHIIFHNCVFFHSNNAIDIWLEIELIPKSQFYVAIKCDNFVRICEDIVINLKMKGNKRTNEKETTKTKTKSPHSIGASVSPKILNVSKKSQTIKKQSDKSQPVQSKLMSVKNENGSKTLVVTKTVHEIRPAKSSSVVAAAQVELKVSVKSPMHCKQKAAKKMCVFFN